MKAVVQNACGSPSDLELAEVDKPVVKQDAVLVRVQAAALNAGDTFTVRGHPWLVRFYVGFPRPKDHVLGWDVAGRIEAVGANVKRFQPGDEVVGACSGTLAEYACATETSSRPNPRTSRSNRRRPCRRRRSPPSRGCATPGT